jgi:hypothetical protein
MQHRYVGDIGDFAKYALLRRLAGAKEGHDVRLGIVWCLYPNESHNNDGRHISYLRRPDYAELDPKLLAVLQDIVASGRRSIAAVADAEIFPPSTVFYDALSCLPRSRPSKCEDRLRHRSRWLEGCFSVTEGCELVFFDPDNGIEVASVSKRHPSAGKYIYWDELQRFWVRGQSLLIYHHLNRTKPAAEQVVELSAHLRAEFVGALVKPLVFRRGSCRVFWLVCLDTSSGREIEAQANAFLSNGWTAHFRPFD